MGFSRKKESFSCERCGAFVEGNGYTNHCPKCLYSRHVDISPGDRAEECQGIMEPVSVFRKNGEDRIFHRCLSCGFERENRISDDDDRDAMMDIIRKASDAFSKN